MPNEEMQRVELRPGDVRRVHPKDMDRFMEQNPGARQLGDKPASEIEGAVDLQTEQAANNAAGKAMSGAPANKSQRKAGSK